MIMGEENDKKMQVTVSLYNKAKDYTYINISMHLNVFMHNSTSLWKPEQME